MERSKMPRINRAAQFAPFDSLKGLQEALRLKEFEHEKVAKGELSEEDAEKISHTLSTLKKKDFVTVTYYDNRTNHYITISGNIEPHFDESYFMIYTMDNKKMTIDVSDLTDITLSENKK